MKSFTVLPHSWALMWLLEIYGVRWKAGNISERTLTGYNIPLYILFHSAK